MEVGDIRGILFDKDGTLLHFRQTWLPVYRGLARDLASAGLADGSAEAQARLAAALLARLGHDPDGDRFTPDSPLLWSSNADLVMLLAGEPELASVDVATIAAAHLDDPERYPPVPVGDLAGLCARLRRHGLKLGIATMDSTCAARHFAARFGLERHLCFVAGFDAGHGRKPAAALVQAFCAAAGLRPSQVLVAGDTLVDLQMARAAGATALAVLTGVLPADALSPHADAVLPSVHDLEAWLIGTGRLASAADAR